MLRSSPQCYRWPTDASANLGGPGVAGSSPQAGRRKRGRNERAMAAVTETGAEPPRGVRLPRGRPFPFALDPFQPAETKEAHLAGGPPTTEFRELRRGSSYLRL